jgi:hypothetical protein
MRERISGLFSVIAFVRRPRRLPARHTFPIDALTARPGQAR